MLKSSQANLTKMITHRVQKRILENLLFKQSATFSQLNNVHLDNNHFNFHLRHLVDSKLIEKKDKLYMLTVKGMELAGRLDTQKKDFTFQPKIGVCIFVEDKNKGVLLGKRLKDPGAGKYNFFTRKVEFGKSIHETANECLEYETGLKANFEISGYLRHLSKDYDVVFICLRASKISGVLKQKTKESDNKWFKLSEAKELKETFISFGEELELFKKKKMFFKEVTNK